MSLKCTCCNARCRICRNRERNRKLRGTLGSPGILAQLGRRQCMCGICRKCIARYRKLGIRARAAE